MSAIVGAEPSKSHSGVDSPGWNGLPNFLYIGTSKAASTWLFKVLSWHPQIYMYAGKNLSFFSRNFDKGLEWYRSRFDPEPQHRVVGEVSHNYLISEGAPARIREILPDVKLLVCLRDPVQRTFSDYLEGINDGKFSGSLDEELERRPGLIDKSRYGTHIARYLEHFRRDQLHIACFEELGTAPDTFTARIFDFLGVDALKVPADLREKVLPAGIPRSARLASIVRKLTRLAPRLGFSDVRGVMKTSPKLRNALYRPYDQGSKPTIPPATEAYLRELMTPEVQCLDEVAGTDFCSRWNYPPVPA